MREGHWKLKSEEKIGWSEYPRPQMKRDSYFSLNGLWKLNGEDIEVPFPPESDLSGYRGIYKGELTYVKYFKLPSSFKKDKV